MKKLTSLEKFGLIAVVIVCGSYFYLKNVYEPEAESLQRTVVKLNQIIEQYNAFEDPPPVAPVRESVERLQGEHEEAAGRLREAGGRTGEAHEITNILSEITSLSRRNRIVIVRIVPGGKRQGVMFNWAVFTAEMSGSYHDLKNFIASLKKMPQPVRVEGLKLERGSDGNLLTIRMTLMI